MEQRVLFFRPKEVIMRSVQTAPQRAPEHEQVRAAKAANPLPEPRESTFSVNESGAITIIPRNNAGRDHHQVFTRCLGGVRGETECRITVSVLVEETLVSREYAESPGKAPELLGRPAGATIHKLG
jgi:hypothetical protein